ncbi:MAG: nucleotidyltransferase family protein [Thermoprotei archaeon]|nr:nucleotidyltransferase family protein [Thermoprotei archaeon]
MSIIAAILAGGEGSRFRPYTEIVPKPMIPIGPEEKPLLEYIIRWLAKYDIRDIVLLVGYKWKQIRNYFSHGERWNVKIRYSLDTKEYRNTGGALLNAYNKRILNDSDIVLIWYGDILAPLNVKELLNMHHKWKADATIVLANKYQVPVGVAKINDNNDVIELKEKPWIEVYVTIGVLTLNVEVLKNIEEELGRSFDIMGDLVPWMIKNDYIVKAYVYKGPWYDMGSLERYKKLDYDEIKEFLKE